MKITAVDCLYSGNDMIVRISTDEGITGYGEATFTARQKSVEMMVEHFKPSLLGQDPLRTDFIWYDLMRSTARRGGYIIMTAISGVDEALWDIKGKAYQIPVYQMLGGKQRDRILMYRHINGDTVEELLKDAEAALKKGYKVLRYSMPEAEDGIFDTRKMIRASVERTRQLREFVGEDIELIYDGHSRFNPARSIELCNAVAEYGLLFMEDPLIADDLEDYRTLRQHTNVPIGTGEKLGPIWDYTTLIGDRLIDYVRTDICNCGGITSMKKIAVYAESAHMDMVPHGLRTFIGMMSAFHVDISTPNFFVQEQGLFDFEHYRGGDLFIECDMELKDGYCYLGDTPGLGITVHEDQKKKFICFERPHWRRPDGSVQDW